MTPVHSRFAGLGTRVAARTFALFCVCAILPIVISATIADRLVSGKLREQATSQLTQTSKSYGLLVFERLRQTDEALAELAGLRAENKLQLQDVRSFSSTRFRIVAVAERAGAPIAFARGAIATMDEADHQVSLALFDADRRREVQMTVVKQAGSQRVAITASLRDSYLWDADALYLNSMRLCVRGSGAEVLTCVGELPASSGDRAAKTLSGEWTLFLPPRYGAAAWLVRTEQPTSVALSTLDSFRRTLPIVTLIAIALALLLSTVQIRRSHRPLAVLTQAAQEIGRRRFKRVKIDSNDEYRHLGEAFNRMSSGLARQFGMFRTLARIDRMILDDPSTDTIMERILPSLPSLLRSPVVAVAVAVRDTAEISIFLAHSVQGATPLSRLQLPAREVASLIGDIPASASPLIGLDAGIETPALFGIPIEVDGTLRGALILGGGHRRKGSDGRHARGLAQRFAVALGSEERRQALLRQAYYDTLTGLPNRQLFKDRLQRELAHARRSHTRIALIYIDLDRFKNVNDSMGHSAGDELLAAVSRRLASQVRECDTLARLGGDEFVVIAVGLLEHPAHVLAERLQASLREPLVIQSSTCFVKASIGLAIYPEDGADAEALLRNADLAMYRAKAAGSGVITYFEEGMNREAQRLLQIEQRLRVALRDRTMTQVYQPKISLADGSVCGVEALARWTDSQLGMVSPAVFIPVAEECGLIDELGIWALNEACATFQRLRQEGVELGHVGVNVSMRQLHDRRFVLEVLSALERARMNAGSLEIEVTESALADNPHEVIALLSELRLMGVRVAIDDFGTGYSSMSSLGSLPTDALKIDRSFVVDCATQQTARSVVAAIISMAHVLGKVTVAEGVETREQLNVLRQLGCDFVQGYLLAKPMPAHELKSIAGRSKAWRELVGACESATPEAMANRSLSAPSPATH